MPTYIGLYNYTEQGIRNVKDSPARLDAAKQLVAGLGGEMKAFYLTMGVYDIVTVIEAPDDETAAKATLALTSGGNVKGNTLKAFPEADFRNIIAGLP